MLGLFLMIAILSNRLDLPALMCVVLAMCSLKEEKKYLSVLLLFLGFFLYLSLTEATGSGCCAGRRAEVPPPQRWQQ